ncbi:MAG: hypothetical protein SF069_09395 [Phycisphaerae bacterium]|nr:hypothetical protein [Phycisphaerae bacterium]
MRSHRLSVVRSHCWSPPALLVAVAAVAGAAVAEECQPGWILGGGYPGVRGSVSAAVPWDVDGPGPEPERLLIAGEFDLIGDVFVEDFAFWDGERISATPLPALTGTVDTAFVFDGELYVGGSLDRLTSPTSDRTGGPYPPRIFRWRAGEWKELTMPLETQFWYSSMVYEMGEYDGALCALAQNFAGSSTLVLRLSGSSFETIGVTSGGHAFALTEFGGELLVGGQFSGVGGVSSRAISAWNGATWRRFDPLNRPSNVNDLMVFGGVLHIAGFVVNAGDVGEVSVFDGTTFRPAGGGVRGSVVRLGEFNGQLIAAGDNMWTPSFATQRGSIMRLENQNWWPVVGEFGFPERQMTVIADYDGELIFAGGFGVAGGKRAVRLARTDGVTVTPFGRGFDEPVRALECSGGQLFVGGEFGGTVSASNPPVNFAIRVERRVGVNGTGTGRPDRKVLAFANAGSDLFMLGEFNIISGQSRGRITRWTGDGWGFLPSPNQPVPGGGRSVPELFAAVEWRGRLYVGGTIVEAGQNPGVLVLEDDRWAVVGAPQELYGVVQSLAVHNDRLFAAGVFSGFDGQGILGLAAFDGVTWQSPGAQLPNGGRLVVHEGELIAAGAIMFGSTSADIAAYDGAAWRALSGGATPSGVSAIRSVDEALYVAGDAQMPSDAANPQQLFRWDGAGWSPIPGVLSGRIEAIAAYDGRIVVGGEFDAVDGVVSSYIAEFGCASLPRPGDLNCDGFATVADIPAFVLALLDPAGYAGQYPECDVALADTNDDGFVTVADIGRFVERLTL